LQLTGIGGQLLSLVLVVVRGDLRGVPRELVDDQLEVSHRGLPAGAVLRVAPIRWPGFSPASCASVIRSRLPPTA
jgi:hypothetical protein